MMKPTVEINKEYREKMMIKEKKVILVNGSGEDLVSFMCEYVKDEQGSLLFIDDLYQQYQVYLENMGKFYGKGRNQFGKDIAKYPYENKKRKNKNGEVKPCLVNKKLLEINVENKISEEDKIRVRLSQKNEKIYEESKIKEDKYVYQKLRGTHTVDNSRTVKKLNDIVGGVDKFSLLMKMPCAFGKTIMTKEYNSMLISNNENIKILYIVSKISFGRKLHNDLKDLGFTFYLDVKDDIQNQDRLIISIDSMWKVGQKYDVLVLDEINSIIDQLVGFTNKKRACSEALIEYYTNTDKVIVSDAFLRQTTVDYLLPLREDTIIYENVYPTQKDKRVDIYKNEGNFLNDLFNRIINNEKIIIPCGSKSDLDALNIQILNKYKDAVVLTYTSDEPICEDPSIEWEKEKPNVVLFTSVIDAGVSFTSKYFTKCMGYFSPNSFGPETAAQMCFRARALLDNTIAIYIKPKGNIGMYIPNFISSIDGIKSYVLTEHSKVREGLMEYISKCYINRQVDVDHFYFKMFADYTLKTHMGRNDYEGMFLRLLRSQGVKLGNYITCNSDKLLDEFEAIKKEHMTVKQSNSKDYDNDLVNSEIISDEIAENFRLSEVTRLKDKLCLQKHKYLKKFRLKDINLAFYKSVKDRFKQHKNVNLFSKLTEINLYKIDGFQEKIENYKEHIYDIYDKIFRQIVDLQPPTEDIKIELYELLRINRFKELLKLINNEENPDQTDIYIDELINIMNIEKNIKISNFYGECRKQELDNLYQKYTDTYQYDNIDPYIDIHNTNKIKDFNICNNLLLILEKLSHRNYFMDGELTVNNRIIDEYVTNIAKLIHSERKMEQGKKYTLKIDEYRFHDIVGLYNTYFGMKITADKGPNFDGKIYKINNFWKYNEEVNIYLPKELHGCELLGKVECDILDEQYNERIVNIIDRRNVILNKCKKSDIYHKSFCDLDSMLSAFNQ